MGKAMGKRPRKTWFRLGARRVLPLVLASAGCTILGPDQGAGPATIGALPPPPPIFRPADEVKPAAPAQGSVTPVRFDQKRTDWAAPEGVPEPVLPASVTLDQAINATLLANPKIRAGLEAINQALADQLTSSLPPNPTLLADVQLLPLTRPFTVDRQ